MFVNLVQQLSKPDFDILEWLYDKSRLVQWFYLW